MQADKALNKPSIIICMYPDTGYEAKLRELKAGMEEEGVPCSLVSSASADAVTLAYMGAQRSSLGVGIGVSPDALCVHYHKLPERQPLFILEGESSLAAWRTLGYNAARLVKGLPFKETMHGEQSVDETAANAGCEQREIYKDKGRIEGCNPYKDMAELYTAIREIVLKVLQENAQGHGEVNTWSKTP